MGKPLLPRRSEDEIDAEASLWFSRRDAGLSASEEEAFSQWLAADPRHAEVWREYEDSLDRVDALRLAGRTEPLVMELARRQQRRRWRVLGAGLAMAGAAAAMGVILLRTSGLPTAPSVPTSIVVNVPERRSMPDGSLVELKRGAEVEVNFTPGQRRIRLLRGDAHFAVSKDPSRPFVVEVDGVQVRAVGTEFAVGRSASRVEVLVTEGRVAVRGPSDLVDPSGGMGTEVQAGAGNRVIVPSVTGGGSAMPAQVEPMEPAEIERLLGWRSPRIELDGASLADVVEVFNRNSAVKLAVGDAGVAALRMSGSFQADNAEAFARILAEHYGVQAAREGQTLTLRLNP